MEALTAGAGKSGCEPAPTGRSKSVSIVMAEVASLRGIGSAGIVLGPLVVEEELVGVAGVLSEAVLGPHHQILVGWLLL